MKEVKNVDNTKHITQDVRVVADASSPGDWRVEAIGHDGEVYIAIFCGPLAKERAKNYTKWQYNQEVN